MLTLTSAFVTTEKDVREQFSQTNKEKITCIKGCIYFFIEQGIVFVIWSTSEFEFLFVCFVALRPKSTAMVMAGRSVDLTTLFPGQACTSS